MITLNVKTDDKPERNEEYQIHLVNITTYGNKDALLFLLTAKFIRFFHDFTI
jgi:hypothetical protein